MADIDVVGFFVFILIFFLLANVVALKPFHPLSVTISTNIESGENEKKYKPMHKVYSISLFFLAFLGMYPNDKYDHIRKKTTAVLVFFMFPGVVIMSVDARERFFEKDYENISRQIIAIVSIIFTSIKMVCSIVKKAELRAVIDQVNRDYERFNNMPADYQRIVDDSIQISKRVDKVWHSVLYATSVSYPSIAIVSTMLSQLFSDTPQRYMLHEVSLWMLDKDQQYETPYFEYVLLYELYIVLMVTFGFLGYDSSFIIVMFHAALKLKLVSLDLVHLLDDADDIPLIRSKIAKFVRSHQECRTFVDNIQKSYEVWLAGIFCHGILQLGMALTQTTSQESGGTGSTFTYYFYVIATVLHIFLPCFLASELMKLEGKLAIDAYECPWEDVPDKGVRNSIIMIINSAQIPNEFTAVGMITFNMELFVSILQTSYSMYTLLRN